MEEKTFSFFLMIRAIDNGYLISYPGNDGKEHELFVQTRADIMEFIGNANPLPPIKWI